MKKGTQHTIYAFLIITVANAVILYRDFRLRREALQETSFREFAEWALLSEIRNVGQSFSMDSVMQDYHLILRYDASTCLPCIAKAEELLEDVFGKKYLTKELCCIGEQGQVRPSKDIRYVQSDKRLTPMDDVYTPYFCVVNDSGNVLFTLSLIPDMYDYNRVLLEKLKKSLADM